MAKKKTTAVIEYKVLIECHNQKQSFEIGDVVTKKDFPQAVIDNWLALEPPVLEAKN